MGYRSLIARRYLASRKQVTLISVITGLSTVGVTLGVAALIVVLSVMNGFYDFVQGMMVAFDPHVRVVSAEGGDVAEADSLVRVARQAPHVQYVAPYVEGKALLVREDGTDAGEVILVRGMPADTASRVGRLVRASGVGAFSLERRASRPGVVVSLTLAERLGLLPGTSEGRAASRVGLLTAPGIEQSLTQVFGAPPVTQFDVRGLYEAPPATEQQHVFVGLAEAQRLFRTGDRVTGVEMLLDDYQNADAVQAYLQERLPGHRYLVETWYDIKDNLYDVMRLEKWGASAILVLIVIVAAFNIVGSLTMVVIEKRRDVGVLQAMGVSPANIRRIFLTEGALIGLIGTGAGVVLGLGLALLQQHFKLVPLVGAESFLIDAYPVSIQLSDVALVALVSMALCMLAAWYPAVRAASIEPARAVQMDG